MIHTVVRLARRSRGRLVSVWLSLALTAAICCVFAWMAPSLVAARTSGLLLLPPGDRLEVRASANGDPTCSGVFDFIYVVGQGGATAHPMSLVSGRLPHLIGLEQPGASAAIVVDDLVGTEGGLRSGDEVSIVFPDRTVQGKVSVRPRPARLDEGSTGTMWLNLSHAGIAEALVAYGAPDRALCLGSAAGPTVTALLDAAREASAHEGLSSSGDVFAALVGLAWLAVALLTLVVTLHRRRAHMTLVRGLGASRTAAMTLGSADALAVSAGAALSGAMLALWLRSDLLHLWTDASAVAPTVLILFCALALAALLAGIATWRLLP